MSFQSWNQNSAVEMLTVSKTPLTGFCRALDPATLPISQREYFGIAV
jgi:hypothetical protein